MTQQHSITPPPELVQQWLEELYGGPVSVISPFDQRVLIAAAQWGADQELEACCEWLHWQNLATHPELIPSLRAARRPKAPSLKEQALEMLENAWEGGHVNNNAAQTIRRALEALND
jgi:hypothetical protein